MDWVQYWNASSTVYVSERHKAVHYALVADGIARLVPRADATVLDYGCGEALSAERVGAHCARLYLCDAAESVRDRLSRRLGGAENIEVIAPEDLSSLPAGSVHLVVVNSVVQYLDEAALGAAIERFKRLLAEEGRIVFADIVPPDASAVDDARALIGFATRNGFLTAALAGLVRTAFSDYRRVRAELGLSRYTETGFLDLLARHGLKGERIHPNLGHNQGRMAFSARSH